MKKNATLPEVRAELFETMVNLKEGKVSPLVADGIYKLSISIVDSYRVQLKAIEQAQLTNKEHLNYNQAAKLIEK